MAVQINKNTRKKVRFGKDKQNKSKVATNTITRPESPVIDLTQQETISFDFLQEPTQIS